MAVVDTGAEPTLSHSPAYLASLEPVRALPEPGDATPWAQTRRYALRRLVAADILGLLVAALLGPLLIAGWSTNPALDSSGKAYLLNVAAVPLFIAVFTLYGLYRGASRRIVTSVFADLRNIAHGILMGGIAYSLSGFLVTRHFRLSALSEPKIIAMCLVAAVTVPLSRVLSSVLADRVLVASVPVIVVGTGKLAQTVAGHLRAHATVNFLGFVDDSPIDTAGLLGDLEDLPALCREHGVARVVVCFSRTHPERTTEILRELATTVAVSIVPRYYELITARSHVEDLSGLPMIDIAPPSLSATARFAKRSVDLLVSSVLLVFLSPLLVLCALAVKATSPGPVFFRQTRTGRGHAPFTVLKFRTMSDGAEARRGEIDHLNEVDGPLFKVTDDPRVTRVGRFLRRTSLDEIPQLINVWRGDMSLVGPRPFVVSEAAAIDGWATKRFEARPGMTGLWQVSGRNELSHLELCRLDYVYVASWSFWWDMQILWKTPATVFGGRGAS